MIIAKLNLGDALQAINQLMESGQWREAHRACIEVLRFDPENIKIIRLKNKIESKVRKINIDAIKDDLKNLMPLYKAKNYTALMENLKQLEPFIEQYKPLKKFIFRVNAEYEKYMAAQTEKYYRLEVESVKKSIREGNFQEAIRIAEKLRLLNIHYPDVKALIAETRKKWIDHELELKRGLIESEKWEDILLFYYGLQRIDDKSQKVKSLIENANKRAKLKKIEEKRDFIYSGLEKIRTLFQLRKFESAMLAAEEILSIDPDNKLAKKYLQKAVIKVKSIIDRELIAQMKSARHKMKQDMKINRQNYIRL